LEQVRKSLEFLHVNFQLGYSQLQRKIGWHRDVRIQLNGRNKVAESDVDRIAALLNLTREEFLLVEDRASTYLENLAAAVNKSGLRAMRPYSPNRGKKYKAK
jgi:hypothetical protein